MRASSAALFSRPVSFFSRSPQSPALHVPGCGCGKCCPPKLLNHPALAVCTCKAGVCQLHSAGQRAAALPGHVTCAAAAPARALKQAPARLQRTRLHCCSATCGCHNRTACSCKTGVCQLHPAAQQAAIAEQPGVQQLASGSTGPISLGAALLVSAVPAPAPPLAGGSNSCPNLYSSPAADELLALHAGLVVACGLALQLLAPSLLLLRGKVVAAGALCAVWLTL